MNRARYFFLILSLTVYSSQIFAADEDFTTQLMRATFKITHEKSTATGFILKKNNEEKYILITAAHVLSNTPGDETTLQFRTKKADGEYTKAPVKVIIRKDSKPLWVKHPTEDVAVLWVTPPKNADLSNLSTDLLASDALLQKHKVHPGDLVSVLGYPHRVESNNAGFPILRHGSISTFPLYPTAKTRTFFLSGNIFEGDSGGPVSLSRPSSTEPNKEETRLILGLVSAQQFLDEDVKLIYGTSKIRHRLGLAIIIHASLIHETIDLLK
jgi:hypothetical protein